MKNELIDIHEGETYGELTVLSTNGKMKDGRRGIVCRCSCGAITVARPNRLKTGRTVSCGHYRASLNIGKQITRDISIGETFARFTVIRAGIKKDGGKACECRCQCGNILIIRNTDLLNGRVKSCGCLRKEGHPKHGLCKSRIYGIYAGMKDRCGNPNNTRYSSYGGAGINVCEEWKRDFTAFYKWSVAHGYKNGLTIDRIDNDKGYNPDNCRWATPLEQARNKRNTVLLEYKGKMIPLRVLSEMLGIPRARLDARYRAGIVGKDLFTPHKLKTGKKEK